MTQNKNAVQAYKTGLVKTQETFIKMLEHSGQNMAIQYDTYQLMCARNMMNKMVEILWKDNLTINQINQNNITDILQTVAMLKLNASASPREVYVITRNVKVGEKWEKVFEMGVEGDGNDKILREYGVNVAKVHTHWAVREGDEFTYPSFKGLEIVPPTWSPKSYNGKVVRVVYPIEMSDGTVEYHIAERESVTVNLQAHISNNLMKNKNIGDKKKQEILDKIAGMTLDELYADKEIMEIASPAWRSAHSREAMLLRKMRNNAIKKIPKDFQNSFVEKEYEKTFDDYDQYRVNPEEIVDAEFKENAGREPVEIELINEESTEEEVVQDKATVEVEEEKPAPKKAPF